MAKRKYSNRKTKKLQPAVMNLSFTPMGNGTNYIDLSRAASVVNRRFYRQGINWSVAGFTVTTAGNTAPGSVTICKAPTTWVTYNAWVKGRAMWEKMKDQVLDGEPSIDGKYADFKINLDSTMAGASLQTANPATSNQILQPVDCAYNFPYNDGGFAVQEWVYSDIHIPTDGGAAAPEEFNLHLVGGDSTGTNQSKGVIHGYGLSRSRPINTGDPNVGIEGWMTELFDLADNLEEVRDGIITHNDRPPYPVEDSSSTNEAYPGGQQYSTEVVGYASFGTSVGSTGSITLQRSIKGGMFPCGLIEVKSDLSGPSFYDLIVHLVPGHHRGYLCEPMEDV